jgi:NAD(P)-dependent dehydrogenase (short-subunit alcohol dehydrogenase family)
VEIQKRNLRPKQSFRSGKGKEERMNPEPVYDKPFQNKKLLDKIAIITGGDSGIGRAIAIAFAKEGAKVVIAYDMDDKDASVTPAELQKTGNECLLIRRDISSKKDCHTIVTKTIRKFNKIDILINNAAVQFPQKKLSLISEKQLKRTFEVTIYSKFYLVQAAKKYLGKKSCTINTTSITAYRGSDHLLDYASTKGAILAFTRSLSAYFVKKGVRVNGVAPGPIWTPLIPGTFPPKEVASFGPTRLWAEPANLQKLHRPMCFWPPTPLPILRARWFMLMAERLLMDNPAIPASNK